jgi:hypothetical protein
LTLRRATAALAAAVGSLLLASSAQAATLTVDDDRIDCPTAQYTSIQAAVDAAATGDTVAVCAGDYEEGSGAQGTNAITISKSIILKGAGAGLVHISPKATTPTGGQILEASPSLRNGIGDVIAVNGTPSHPLTVGISGVTVDGYDAEGRPVAVEAGIVFLDAMGSVDRVRVTNVVTSEGDQAYTKAGGWRGTQPGVGIAQTTNALVAPVDGARKLYINRTRVDKYNQVGILIDGATGDTTPLSASGTINSAYVTATQIVGRTECVNYQGTGNCSSVGLLTTGPLFGQDGIRATAGARVKVSDSLISQNLVNGTGAPVRTTIAANGTITANTTNNANLSLGAGIRLLGAGLTSYSSSNGQVVLSSATTSNITDNAYGVLNLAADGTTTQTGSPTATGNLGNVFKAENDFWGENYYRSVNPGPAMAPTDNPPVPENPVSGTASVADGTGTTSNSVDYYPFRSGQQADMANGEWPVLSAPIPVDDAAPTVAITGGATVARGATMTVAATAADDFGVKAVTFYDGATKIGTSTGPSYTASEAIPATAACGSRAVSAVAEDSLGQTAVATGTVTVTGCDGSGGGGGGGGGTTTTDTTPTTTVTNTVTNTVTERVTVRDETPPAAAVAAAPTIAANVPGTIAARGATIGLRPEAASGIRSVDVYLGTRKVCSFTSAPYSACVITPKGDEVGGQVVRAVVTDGIGRSADAVASTTVAKFAPRGLSVRIGSRNVSGGNVRKTIAGRVLLPSGVSAAEGCAGGAVTIVVRRLGRSVSNADLDVNDDCTFTQRVTARRVRAGSGAFAYAVRFTGTAVLQSASSTRRSS